MGTCSFKYRAPATDVDLYQRSNTTLLPHSAGSVQFEGLNLANGTRSISDIDL